MYRVVVFYRGDANPEEFDAFSVTEFGSFGRSYFMSTPKGDKIIPVDVVQGIEITPIKED